MSLLKSITLNEQQYLCTILHHPNLLDEEDGNFCTNQIAKDIFDSLYTLKEGGASFSTHTIVSEGSKRNSEINEKLVDLLRDVDFQRNDWSYYRKRLREDNAKHYIQTHVVKDLLANVSQKGELNIELLQKTIQEIEKGIATVEGKDKILLTMKDLMDDYEEEMERRENGLGYISSGDSYLNSRLHGGGLMKGSITLIYGPSGVGKSIYSLNLVSKQINCQIPCLYVPTEMGKFSSLDRLLAGRMDMNLEDIVNLQDESTITQVVKDEIVKEREKLNRVKYFRYVDSTSLSISDLERQIVKAKKEMNVDSLVVTVDLLTMLKDFNQGRGTTADAYEQAMNKLHVVVRKHEVALIGVVQASRPKEKVVIKEIKDAEKFRPTIEQLKNSSALEERSRVILGIFRAKHFLLRALPEDPAVQIMDDLLDCSILKQNMSSLSRLTYLYNGEKSKLWKFIGEEN